MEIKVDFKDVLYIPFDENSEAVFILPNTIDGGDAVKIKLAPGNQGIQLFF